MFLELKSEAKFVSLKSTFLNTLRRLIDGYLHTAYITLTLF